MLETYSGRKQDLKKINGISDYGVMKRTSVFMIHGKKEFKKKILTDAGKYNNKKF